MIGLRVPDYSGSENWAAKVLKRKVVAKTVSDRFKANGLRCRYQIAGKLKHSTKKIKPRLRKSILLVNRKF